MEEEIIEFVCLRVPSNETTHFRVSCSELRQRLDKAFHNSIIPKLVSHLHLIDGKITFEHPYDHITRQTDDERAAVKIQAQWKGHQMRKEKKEQEEAAMKIQARWKGHQVRKKNEEEAAATKIQARWKGHKARQELNENMKENTKTEEISRKSNETESQRNPLREEEHDLVEAERTSKTQETEI